MTGNIRGISKGDIAPGVVKNNVFAMATGLAIRRGVEMRDLVRLSEIEPRKKDFWKLKSNCIITNKGGYDYAVELVRIRTRDDILMWVSHLAQKTWMTKEGLKDFVDLLLGNRADIWPTDEVEAKDKH